MPNPSQPGMPGWGAEVEKAALARSYQGMAGIGALKMEVPSELEMLRQKKVALEYELQKVADAIKALEDHPEIEEVLRLLRRAL